MSRSSKISHGVLSFEAAKRLLPGLDLGEARDPDNMLRGLLSADAARKLQARLCRR
jgi:hypothetical protein